ncbi:MAG: fluoride efflux transporter CrcB [Candidatus Electryonea clarkiae]|nr:fluoride efflux transporter CrcB [Candidatus Electryonea clarkiae]MDP8288646.1 fluoride efflux transporter CrcB [Candidatus Electryonea clarkiae]
MRNLLMIAVAGGLGTLARYGTSGLAYRLMGTRLPWGTLMVNVIGCFLLGFLMHIGINSTFIPREWRITITVGFLGAFTTFSTFGYETVRYIEDGAWWQASLNIATNLGFGILAVILGLYLGKMLMGGS